MDKETGERREEEIEIKKRVGRTAKENEKGGGSIPLPSSSSWRNGTASLKEFIHVCEHILVPLSGERYAVIAYRFINYNKVRTRNRNHQFMQSTLNT